MAKNNIACSEANCQNLVLAKGLCNKHYSRNRVKNRPADYVPRNAKVCSEPGCTAMAIARSLCNQHYQHYKRENLPWPEITVDAPVCSVSGCIDKFLARGFCDRHYREERNKHVRSYTSLVVCDVPPAPPKNLIAYKKPDEIKQCSHENCERPVHGRGFCKGHHAIELRHGRIENKRSRIKSVWAAVDKSQGPDGCWLWTRGKNHAGYGSFYYKGKNTPVHRVTWEETNGPISDGLFVLHKCDNPPCCNPSHLFLGTHLDNMRDKTIKKRNNTARGEDAGASRLKEQDILAIRKLRSEGNTLITIAKIFGTTESHIHGICVGRSWSHIKDDS